MHLSSDVWKGNGGQSFFCLDLDFFKYAVIWSVMFLLVGVLLYSGLGGLELRNPISGINEVLSFFSDMGDGQLKEFEGRFKSAVCLMES